MVRKGYKNTEVGVIPEDWEVVKLVNILDVIDGDRGKNYPSTNDFFSDGYCLFLSARNVTKEGFQFSECFFITAERDELLGKGKLERKDIVLTTRGTVGNIALFDDAVLHENIRINSGMVILRSVKNTSDARFLYTILKSDVIQNQIERTVFGSAQPQLTVRLISRFKIPLPPLPEQKAIARALSDVDALIAALDKLIDKKRHIKTATMQQLLTGKIRLPGFGEGKGYKNTDVGLIPEDWEVAPLEEVGQTLIGLTYSPDETRNYGTLVLRSSNIQDERLVYENNVYVDTTLPLPARVIVEEGDILICVRNGSRQLIGKCAVIDSTAAGSAFGAFMSVFRTKIFGFVFYQFQSDVVRKQISETMGATINQITNKDLAAFKIPLPPLPEQKAIATILTDIDGEIAALEKRRAKTQAIKKGMMQELLTGKTRLI